MPSVATVDRVTDRAEPPSPPANPVLAVQLVPLAVAALVELRALTGHSRTDVVNRALQVYALVERERAAGRDVAVLDADGDGYRVRLR